MSRYRRDSGWKAICAKIDLMARDRSEERFYYAVGLDDSNLVQSLGVKEGDRLGLIGRSYTDDGGQSVQLDAEVFEPANLVGARVIMSDLVSGTREDMAPEPYTAEIVSADPVEQPAAPVTSSSESDMARVAALMGLDQ